MGDDGARAAEPALDTPGLVPEPVLLEQDFDAGSLYALRAAVAAHAAEAGMSGARLYDVVTAAHELAANAVRHGAGNGRLILRLADDGLHCQVSDGGRPAPALLPADRNGDAGPASWPAEHGHGLWVLGQVADRFSIDRDAAATTATAVFTLGASAPPVRKSPPDPPSRS